MTATEPVSYYECSDDQPCRLHSDLGAEVLPCSGSNNSQYLADARPHNSLDIAVLHYELWLVQDAMRRAKGVIAHAADLLNLDRQSLTFIIDGRLAFANLRTTPKRTRKSRKTR